MLKKADLFAWPIELRVKRSKQGGASDHKIGSWTGLFLSFIVIGIMVALCALKWQDMTGFKKTKYSSLTIRNALYGQTNLLDKNLTSEVKLSEHDFMPSI